MKPIFTRALRKETGMTLLEILVSVGIFAFMFIFIAQITKQNYRQVKKMTEDSQAVHSLSHILDTMRQDFRGISYLLDTNHNLYAQFPIEEEDFVESESQKPLDQPPYKQIPLFFSSQYLFEGSENHIEFSSYSFVERSEQEAPFQWIRLRYSIETCPQMKGKNSQGSCLIRSVSKYWNFEKKEEWQKKLVLLRGFQSLKFAYANTEDLQAGEWQREWETEKVSDTGGVFTDQVLQMPFPSAVKIEGKKGNHQRSFFFPVSSFYLKTWNTSAKTFPGFPEWQAPKKKDKEKTKSGKKRDTGKRTGKRTGAYPGPDNPIR